MTKRKFSRLSQINPFRVVVYALPPFLVSLLLYLLSPNEISSLQLVFALALLQIPWISYLNWKKNADKKIPIFAIISFVYWVYFALSLYWGSRTPSGNDTPSERTVSDESITWSLTLALIGVCAVWAGMKTQVAKYLVPARLPGLRPGSRSLHYLRFLLILSTLLGLSDNVPYMGGEGSQQLLTVIISLVPMLAFSLLFRSVIRGEATSIDKALLLNFLLLRFVTGVSSGWLGAFASNIVICGAVYISERRKIPRLALLLVILFTLFFQVGKKDFRSEYWTSGTQATRMDRVKFWTETSLNKWQDALSDASGQTLAEAMNTSLSRVSLLTQTANVVDLTPETIPYQGGGLYSYMAITLIPRAIWPDKPSINDANQFYQVAYGMTTEEGAEHVQIGVGVMTEAYISFGLYGVVGIMFLMGIFYDFYQKIFFGLTSGALMLCIGIALLPQLMGIEAQMAGYLGGILQQVVLTLIIFLPVIRLSKRPAKVGPVAGHTWLPGISGTTNEAAILKN